MNTNKSDIKIKRELIQLVKKQIDIVSLNYIDVNKIKKDKEFQVQAKFIDIFVKNNINDIAIIKNKLVTRRMIVRNLIVKLLLYCVLMILLHHFILFNAQAPVYVSLYNPTFSILFLIATCIGCGIYLFYGYNIYSFFSNKKILKKEPIDEYLIFLHKIKNRIEALSDREIYLMLNKKELLNNRYIWHKILLYFTKIKNNLKRQTKAD
ncbi:MAG: hypothetical protein LBP85_07125 [Prevotellaceae bacterium]|jgi:hypothetical protein|nr:hypothetical protein [Prevotellaceae bacterium]